MKDPVYDTAFFERIQKEIDQTGKEMILCVVKYMNQDLSRAEFFGEMNSYCDKVEKIRKEERQMLDTFGRIISEIEKLQKK